MGIKVVTHGDTMSLTKHGELIASLTSDKGLTQETVTTLVKLAYQKGREDMKYEFERAVDQLRSSD